MRDYSTAQVFKPSQCAGETYALKTKINSKAILSYIIRYYSTNNKNSPQPANTDPTKKYPIARSSNPICFIAFTQKSISSPPKLSSTSN